MQLGNVVRRALHRAAATNRARSIRGAFVSLERECSLIKSISNTRLNQRSHAFCELKRRSRGRSRVYTDNFRKFEQFDPKPHELNRAIYVINT